MKIPFVGGAYTTRSLNLNAQACINLFPVVDQEGGKDKTALYGTPGLNLFYDRGSLGEVRGMKAIGDYLYAVIGNTLYKLDQHGDIATTITGTLNNSVSPVFMDNSDTQLLIISPGDTGYLHTIGASTVAAISDSDFPTPSSLVYYDTYFIVTEEDTDNYFISSSGDGSAWDALDYSSVEGSGDNTKCAITIRNQLWLFGESSSEIHYNSGDSDFPIERIPGGIIGRGIGAVHSLVRVGDSLVWLDDNGLVVMASGTNQQVISTRQIEYQIKSYLTFEDAIGFHNVQEGHRFYWLTFPTGNATWVYDFTTNFWHQRSSTWEDGIPGRHHANCYAYFKNKHLIGDYLNGKIYELDMDKFTDDGVEIRRVRAAQTIHNERRKFINHRFEIEFEGGTGLETDDSDVGEGDDPQAMLDWSDDEGHTFKNEVWADMGKAGEHNRRAIWRRLGSSRNRVYRVTITDPVKVVIISAYLKTTLGTS